MKGIIFELLVGVVRKPLDTLGEPTVTGPEIAGGSRSQISGFGKLGGVEHFGAAFGVLGKRFVGEHFELLPRGTELRIPLTLIVLDELQEPLRECVLLEFRQFFGNFLECFCQELSHRLSIRNPMS